MMKTRGKFLTVVSVLLLILAFSLTTASAQEAVGQGVTEATATVTFASSFQVLNLSTMKEASIAIYYYNQDGSLATMAAGKTNPVNDVVALNQSKTYYPVDAAEGFSGSVVIASDEQVAVISNLVVNTSATGLGSYVGFSEGASTSYFPLVMKGNANQTTTLAVQNANEEANGAVAITIHFVPEAGSSYPPVTDITDTINLGASHTYDLAMRPEFASVSKWVGSATVSVTDTANDRIVGIANTLNIKYPDAYQLNTYNAFTGGSTEVVLPLIQENNSGNRTSVNCQNIGTGNTTVTVTYTPETGSNPKAPESKANVPQNGMAVFLQDYLGATKFVGSARVTSDPASPLVCVVNQQKPAAGRSSSYEGFRPAAATGTAVLPLIQSRNGNPTNGYSYTSINVATADGASHAIKCDFAPAPGFSDPPDVSKTGASVVFTQDNVFGDGSKFVGGATCTVTDGSGAGLFAIVNQARQYTPQPIRDTLATYDGFNR
jgi:hypothetical protein